MRAVQVGTWERGAAISDALARDGLLAAACCSRDAGGLAAYDSLDSVVRSEEFDAAFVCADAPDPAETAAALLESGKHVLVEGAVDRAGLERLSKSARRRKRVLAFGYAARFNAAIAAAREEAAELGGPRVLILDRTGAPAANLDARIWRERVAGGLDAAACIFGRLPSVVFARSEAVRRECDDFLSVIMGFGGGRTAVLTCSWFEPREAFALDAICRDSRVRADLLQREQPGAEEPALAAARDFCDAVRSGGSPAVTSEYAAGMADAAESVLLSSRKGIPIYLEAP